MSLRSVRPQQGRLVLYALFDTGQARFQVG